MEELLEEGRVKEVWDNRAQWYHQVRGINPPTTRYVLDQVSAERADIYRCRPTEGLQVPLLVRQFDIEYGIPTEAEVEASVRVLKGGRKGVLSGMHAEDLK